MSETIALNKGWKVGWTEFSGKNPDLREGVRAAGIAADVPGDVHLDLIHAGILPDLYTGMNLEQARWMEHKDWWYQCEFPTPAARGDRTALLIFHGLDTFSTVWLNGQVVGQTANMFMRHEFDVSSLLSPTGPNHLVVRLAAPGFSISLDDSHQPMAWSPERLFCRKAQMSFGWDIAPRLVTTGIWRPVELVLVDKARITGVWVSLLDLQGGDAQVRVEVEIHSMGTTHGSARISGTVHDTPWSAVAVLSPGRNVVAAELHLRKPPLWWPIGYGSPSLIRTQTAVEVEGRCVDTHASQTGLRRIELVREPQASGAESFRFRCNGTDLLVTGLNWTPLDAIFASVTPERITHTLQALAGIGCNMLRVWGGGIYEPAHFYEECSRLGIMVWQDFMMACGWYPQTDAFATQLAAEGEQVVRDLRGQPCIAVWAGDNEVDAGCPALAQSNRLTRQTLAAVCRELDPQTPYVPSSPWRPSGAPATWVSATEGDSHYYNHGTNYRAAHFWDIRPRFMSEFGHLSLPSLEVVRRYFPPGTEWPLTGPMWKYHGADTQRVGWFRGPECVLRALQACGKPEPRNIEEAVPASQALQAEAVCAWMERYCEDPECGGFLLWNVADCWPQHSDSVIDYLARPKTVFARLGPLFERLRAQRRQAGASSPAAPGRSEIANTPMDATR